MSSNRKIVCREIHMDRPFLHIPIAIGCGGDGLLRIFVGRYLLHTFRVRLTAENPTYFPLEMSELLGQTLSVELSIDHSDNWKAMDKIVCGGKPEDEKLLYPDLYREPHRPRFHYSCMRGWLNDPNGLFYMDGLWHLYHQHNPLGTTACDRNVSWAHAVSPDLFHWEIRRPAVMPNSEYLMCASGSCLPDTENVLGYGHNAVLAAFTALGVARVTDWKSMPANGQIFAVSTDGGNNFRRLAEQPGIPCERGESWRDPCLFRTSDGYGAAVYETHDEQHMVAFYRSDDLRSWRRTGFAKNLFECPDMFSLTCEETGETRWVLYGGDGAIRVGRYNGEVFCDEESVNRLDYGRAVYAGQTFRNAPEGRKVHIAWACGMGNHRIWDERGMGYEDLPFSQCMTVPCELKLRWLNGRYFVSRTPVKELQTLRCGEEILKAHEEGSSWNLQAGSEYFLEFEPNQSVEFIIETLCFVFDAEKRTITFPNGVSLDLNDTQLRVQILADETTVEVFVNELACATYTMPIEEANIRFERGIPTKSKRWLLKCTH